MKTTKGLFLLLALCFFSTGNAQLWKKITKKAGQAAEDAVVRKVEQKTAGETEKTFDTVFNNKGKLFKNKKAEKLNQYSFSHKYVMEIISDKDTTDITYYLTNENEYIGTLFNTIDDSQFITVMDLPNDAIHTFINMGGQLSTSSVKLDLEEVSDLEMNNDDYNINSTGQFKTILGYKCEEFQITGPQLSGKVWITEDADISFHKAYTQLKSKKFSNIKQGIDPSWLSMVNGLVLEMNMIDYSQKNAKPIEMICTQLIENDFIINTSDYEKTF
ncbi:MAG: DUF4412 domain-containing protein [Maribacter sp.]